jgi:hypothetical protein
VTLSSCHAALQNTSLFVSRAVREQTFLGASDDLSQCLHSPVSRFTFHQAFGFLLGDAVHGDNDDTNMRCKQLSHILIGNVTADWFQFLLRAGNFIFNY